MRPPDADTREAALDPRRSFHLESPAGSGKTTLLAARYLLLLGQSRPEEVLAVTFTRKAAAELRERILRAVELARRGTAGLEGAEASQASPARRATLASLAAGVARRQKTLTGHPEFLAPERLQVMTFHALCAALLERWPLEAGLPPGTRVMDERESPALVREALSRLRRTLLRPGHTGPLRQALERRLLRLDNRWEALEAELSLIIAQRDLFTDLLAEVEEGGAGLAEALRRRLDRLIELRLGRACRALTSTELGGNWPRLMAELRSRGCELADTLPAALPEPLAENAPGWKALCQALLTGSGTPRQRFGPACGYPGGFGNGPLAALIKGLPAECCAALHLCRGLPSPEDSADLGALADLVALAAEAVRLYEDLGRERGLIDFVGLEGAALRVLSAETSPEAPQISDGLLALDARIRHVLVDEFQDTSRGQWLLLRRLCAGFSEGEGRTVFVVGDPKQSIYGFRKAEVALFEEAKRGLPTDVGLFPLEPLRLSANFRSQEALVRWTNRVFERVMAEPFREADEVEFAPAEPTRIFGEGALTLGLFSAGREAEARCLAAGVREAASGLAPGERLAVLLFARSHLATYVRAIREAGVAVSVREGLPLAERPEVASLLALARAVTRPHDDLAWAELLRSPWGLVEAATLCRVAGHEGHGWQERLSAYPDERVAALYEAVARGQEMAGRLPLAEVVTAVWTDLHGPWECVCRLGRASLKNCRATLELLAECDSPGLPEETLAAFEERLDSAFQPPLDDRPESAVQMMTVHAAKGLEFDVVFVPHLDWNPLGRRERPPYLLERLPGGEHVVALPPDRRSTPEDPVWEVVSDFADERRLGEAKRLFYTAATRARRALHLSGCARLSDGRLSPRRNSPLAWLLSAEGVSRPEPGELDGAVLGGLAVRVDPPQEAGAIPLAEAAPEPARPRFTPEPLGYRKLSASELSAEPAEERPPGIFEPSLEARLRGTLIHRLMEGAAASAPMPTPAQVAAALLAEGLAEGRARELAGELLAEVAACLEDPLLAAALAAPERYAELALERLAEGAPGPRRSLDVGIIDLIWRDGQTWWLLDYKTSRPGPGEIELVFLEGEAAKYRPQMAAYRALVASWRGVAEERVRALLYFTGVRRAVEV